MNTPLQKSAAKFALNAINKFISAEHLASVELVDLHIAAGKLSDALEAEQAQAVEPVAWIGDSPSKGNGRRLFWSESAAYAYADKYEPLYLHPAPPAGERAKVGDSRFESWYSELHQAGKGSKQIAREAYEAGLNEAQQVAVPVPMTEDEIFDLWRDGDTAGGATEFEATVRVIEAHHGIKAKPDHTDWSAA